ncbi:sugar-transfer associated ATP-grasp domain-containing protein [Patescibacteria group bacterium]
MKSRDILGLNARNILFIAKYNKSKGKRIANHKLLTKSALQKVKLPIPKLYKVFRRFSEIEKFDYIKKLPDSFVIKPDNSLGGEGILVIQKRGKYAGEWITSTGKNVNVTDFKLLIRDILQGRFSMKNRPDIAFIEERIRIHPAFKKICWGGTPDIGVLVFNKIPIMAYLRLPTKESGGRANMFQGAVACGIDIATGITTHAVDWTKSIRFFPGTKRKLIGVKIPEWDEVLKLAVECQFTIPQLGFMRADIALQPSVKTLGKTFPKVLELNNQPGLKIQLANRAGLRRRLERVEGLKVENVDKGIKIGKALFLDPKLKDVAIGKKTVEVFEDVEVRTFMGERSEVKAKLDTGAYRTSIDEGLADELGLLNPENVLLEKYYKSSLGREKRQLIELIFYLKGRKIKTVANISDRTGLKRRMIIGRRDLQGFLVNPE